MMSKTTERPAPPREATREAAPGPDEARRRAAAYLDLWERQLAHVAAQGAIARRPDPRRR